MMFWKKRKNRDSEVDAIFEEMHAAIFPSGELQIESEATELAKLLGNAKSPKDVKDSLIHAKGRAFLALRSTDSLVSVLDQCKISVRGRNRGKLDQSTADAIAVFAVRKLVEQVVDSIEKRDTVFLSRMSGTKHCKRPKSGP